MKNKQQQVLLTPQGLSGIKKEYEELVKIKRPQAVLRMSSARDLGDLTENSEYSSAKQDLALIDERIAELEEILRGAKVISSSKKGEVKRKVDIGCKVTLRINGKEEVFTIVGEWETNPAERKISHVSPLGKAILGKKVGDKVEVEVPAGKIVYTILKIE